jgi:hypothetical protein
MARPRPSWGANGSYGLRVGRPAAFLRALLSRSAFGNAILPLLFPEERPVFHTPSPR